VGCFLHPPSGRDIAAWPKRPTEKDRYKGNFYGDTLHGKLKKGQAANALRDSVKKITDESDYS
jgi:hypothetical protein